MRFSNPMLTSGRLTVKQHNRPPDGFGAGVAINILCSVWEILDLCG
ncbi:hypothetical protein [Ensifer soli]